MREEFDSFIASAYPELFVDADDPTKSLMGWGCSHGDGWFQIINNLCHSIVEHQRWVNDQRNYSLRINAMIDEAKQGKYDIAREMFSYCKTDDRLMERVAEAVESGYRDVPKLAKPVRVMQIKEKFGTLSFYYEGGDEAIRGMVNMAEAISGSTCEECGSIGRRRGGGWIKTLCQKHAAEKDYSDDPLGPEVGETIQLFTDEGYKQVSVVNSLEDGELEVLDKNNATFKVRPLDIGGVELGVFTPVKV